MTIMSVEIKNFKSIEHIKFDFNKLNVIVGKNGSGKTNIYSAIDYFFSNLTKENPRTDIFDELNTTKKEMEIIIKFDFSKMVKYSNSSYQKRLNKLVTFGPFFNVVVVKMRQRNSHLMWEINGIKQYDKNNLYIIANSHPVYLVYPRNLSINNWESIWDKLGDLINNNSVKNVAKSIPNILPSMEAKKFETHVSQLDAFFKEHNFEIDKELKKQQIISLLKLHLGGSIFKNKDKQLDFYSDGTNSKNYLIFLSYIAFLVSGKRLKDVTVVIDEPELGLHGQIIDQLMEYIVKYSSNTKFVLFSHSSRLTAHVLKNMGDLHKISLNGNYTVMNKIYVPNEPSYRIRISEREASYFFSDFLLLVEGETELELFSHPYLTQTFPVLKKIDIVNTGSDNFIIDILHPEKNKSGIPFLILFDLDKVVNFKFNQKNKSYNFHITNNTYSPIGNEDFYKNILYSYHMNKEYISLYKKLEYSKGKTIPKFSDLGVRKAEDFSDIYRSIKMLSLKFNVYVLKSDIEYSLTNISLLNYFINSKRHKDIFGTKKVNQARENLSKIEEDGTLTKSEKKILFSMLINGKNEYLQKFNIISPYINQKTNYKTDDFITLRNCHKKAIGWVTQYFNFYERRSILYKWSKEAQRKEFKKDFPEIYDILREIERIMRE